MSAFPNASPSFATTPIAAAAGSEARTGEESLVHGAPPASSSMKLEDAARLIREAAAKLWAGSSAAVLGLVHMLINFFRWITRPFRDVPKGPAAEDDARSSHQARKFLAGVPSSSDDLDGLGAAPSMDSGSAVPDDYEGQSEETDTAVPGLRKPVAKLAFPAGFAGNKLAGELPLGEDTIKGVMERLKGEVSDLSTIDERDLPLMTTVKLLEQCVASVTQAQGLVRELDAQIKTQLVALAALSDTPADQLLAQVLASEDLGGLQGAEIRRLHIKRVRYEQQAAEQRGTIENSLLTVKQQGLDVAEIATRANVAEALPDWRARIALQADQAPAPLTPSERQELALDVEPELEFEPSEPSPQRVANLKAALESRFSKNDEHENEVNGPRG